MKSDAHDLELQAAAVTLWERLGRQEAVAKHMRKLYPGRGAFDTPRVSDLCKFAIKKKLASAPSPAKLLSGAESDKWLAKFRDTEQQWELAGPMQSAIKQFCAKHAVHAVPMVFTVPGDVHKMQGGETSEFAINAADVALRHLKAWIRAHRDRRPLLGLTWGHQTHLVAVAARDAMYRGELGNAEVSFMPLVGLPIGGHRSDIMSSSEIARCLARSLSAMEPSDKYDLQLVPAYLPERAFPDTHLPALYTFLKLMDGWSRVFGAGHMKPPSKDVRAPNRPAVFDCDFIWSSVSDESEPFGFSRSTQPMLVPFAPGRDHRHGAGTRPVADCGGIPLWADEDCARIDELEASFEKRWTGIKRHQWRHCVQQGIRARANDNVVSGAVLFAPTDVKARSVLYAVRDGLANVLILGGPCANKILEILREPLTRNGGREDQSN